MKKITSVSFLAGCLIMVCYAIFSLMAFTYYPQSYSPAQNWLSDLGSSQFNPSGAIFYNTGITLTALLLLVFFLGLARLRMDHQRVQNLMVLVTQIFGVLGALAMFMSAVYPINSPQMHSFWSASLYILLGTAFGFSVAVLRYNPGCPRWLLALGVLTALSAMLMGIFQTEYLLEWVTVAFFLGYCLLLGIQTRQANWRVKVSTNQT